MARQLPSQSLVGMLQPYSTFLEKVQLQFANWLSWAVDDCTRKGCLIASLHPHYSASPLSGAPSLTVGVYGVDGVAGF